MKLYVVINKSEFTGDAFVIHKSIKAAKNAFDNYSATPGRTILAEVEADEDFGIGEDSKFWGGEVISDFTREPDDWSSLEILDGDTILLDGDFEVDFWGSAGN